MGHEGKQQDMQHGTINNSRDATPEERARLCYELGLHPGTATTQDIVKALHVYVNDAEPDESGLSPAIAGHRYDAWRGLLNF